MEDSNRNFSCLSDVQFLCILTNSDILASPGCHNKVPQIEWLKTTGIYCLTVLESRSLKLRCQQGYVSSVAWKKEFFFLLFYYWLLEIPSSLYFRIVPYQILFASVLLWLHSLHVCIWIFFISWGPRFHKSIKVYPNINWIMCKSPIF